jgi:hypothetical protein
MRKERWRTIEEDNVTTQGYIIVPIDGTYSRYASPGRRKFFETELKATQALARMVEKGRIPGGAYRVAFARLAEQRKVEVSEQSLRLVIDNT